MKKYIFSLLSALVISSLLVAGYGAHIKYDILKPIGQYQDKSIMELPFLMYSDDALIYILEKQKAAEGPFMQTMPGENVPENGVIVRQTQPEEPSEPPEPVMPTEPEPVDESWFDDALFIGNSLTVGLREFGNFGRKADQNGHGTGAGNHRHGNREECIVFTVAANKRGFIGARFTKQHTIANHGDNETAGNTESTVRDTEGGQQQVPG
jgi:hypothetical protein